MLKQIARLVKDHPLDAMLALYTGALGGALVGGGIWIAIVSITKDYKK